LSQKLSKNNCTNIISHLKMSKILLASTRNGVKCVWRAFRRDLLFYLFLLIVTKKIERPKQENCTKINRGKETSNISVVNKWL